MDESTARDLAVTLTEERLERLTAREAAVLLLTLDRVPEAGFRRLHEIVEAALDRPVWTHELAHPEALLGELLEGREEADGE